MINKTIDVLKLDLVGKEWDFIDNLNIEYACNYVKQLIVETQPFGRNGSFDTLRRIQKCFHLFYRKSRINIFDKRALSGKHNFNLNRRNSLYNIQRLMEKENKENMINYFLLYGELYFANINFL